MTNTEQNPDFYDWLSLQSTQVQNNVEIVNQHESMYPVMLRTDKTVPEIFTPIMPTSAQEYEDNTCPRICVSPTLLDCLAGYGRVATDITGQSETPEEGKQFKGGYHISGFNYKMALAVNQNLVEQAPTTHEHWLVAYNNETRTAKPISYGKCFVKSLQYQNNGVQLPGVLFKLMVEVNIGKRFWVNSKTELSEGYWELLVSSKAKNTQRLDHATLVSYEKVEKSMFIKTKSLSAVLLDNRSVSIPILNW